LLLLLILLRLLLLQLLLLLLLLLRLFPGAAVDPAVAGGGLGFARTAALSAVVIICGALRSHDAA
jgi:hypothetical protein